MYHCASAAALLASASELISDTRVLLLITFDSSALLSSQHDLYLIGAAEDLSYCLDYGWGVTALEIHEGVSIKSGCLATGVLDAGP